MTKTYQETQQDRQTVVCVLTSFIAITAFVLVMALTVVFGQWVGVMAAVFAVLLHKRVPRPFRCIGASTILGVAIGFFAGLLWMPYLV